MLFSEKWLLFTLLYTKLQQLHQIFQKQLLLLVILVKPFIIAYFYRNCLPFQRKRMLFCRKIVLFYSYFIEINSNLILFYRKRPLLEAILFKMMLLQAIIEVRCYNMLIKRNCCYLMSLSEKLLIFNAYLYQTDAIAENSS